jgi:WD40-like Beta Propeller Repeat
MITIRHFNEPRRRAILLCSGAVILFVVALSETRSARTTTGKSPTVNSGLSREWIRTDRALYREPPPPVLPRAGGKFNDPVFGTEIMRATDEKDGAAPGLGTYYSHWPTFNCNNTKLLIRQGDTGNAIIKDFDPITFRIGKSRTLPNSFPGGGGPSWESSIWSNTQPEIIYTFTGYYDGGMKLYSFNTSTNTFKLIKDFGFLSGGKDFLRQMYMSADDDVFCWLHVRSGVNDGEPIFYLVYKRSTDKVLFHNSCTVYKGGVNEVHVDKSGKWLHVVIPTPQADGTGTRFLNLQTGRYYPMTKAVDHIPGHGDLGTETIIGFDNYQNGISWRKLESPKVFKDVFLFRNDAGVSDWTNDFHGSMLADNEDWITIGTHREPGTLPSTGVFRDEIFQVALDGSHRVRRICHTRSFTDNKSDTTGYWAAPKPTISKDGRFIAFTSNWGNSGRYDLFIAKIDPAPRLTGRTQPGLPSSSNLIRQRRVSREASVSPARGEN